MSQTKLPILIPFLFPPFFGLKISQLQNAGEQDGDQFFRTLATFSSAKVESLTFGSTFETDFDTKKLQIGYRFKKNLKKILKKMSILHLSSLIAFIKASTAKSVAWIISLRFLAFFRLSASERSIVDSLSTERE